TGLGACPRSWLPSHGTRALYKRALSLPFLFVLLNPPFHPRLPVHTRIHYCRNAALSSSLASSILFLRPELVGRRTRREDKMSEVSVINQHGGEEEVAQQQPQRQLVLPPGFRFHPNDEEVITSYLALKALDSRFECLVIADVNLNNCEPWDLPKMAKMGEKEWYFFSHKDRKYPTGTRTNRATASGYWKATGKDKEIFRGPGRGVLVGMKKTLVFYLGRAPRGEKTPWVMHEFRLEGKLPPNLPRAAKDEWAVCRVFNKDLAAKPAGSSMMERGGNSQPAFPIDDFDLSDLPPPLVDSPFDDDFKGTAIGAGGSYNTSGGGMNTGGYQQVIKTEQQPAAAQQNPPMPPLPQELFFPMPAANNFAGYPQPQAGGMNQQSAIRTHCPANAPAPPRQQQPLFPPELDAGGLFQFPDVFPDYSTMWDA
ncbi:hypothetical protein EJB05_10495, partial [Eragrostis curvula]